MRPCGRELRVPEWGAGAWVRVQTLSSPSSFSLGKICSRLIGRMKRVYLASTLRTLAVTAVVTYSTAGWGAAPDRILHLKRDQQLPWDSRGRRRTGEGIWACSGGGVSVLSRSRADSGGCLRTPRDFPEDLAGLIRDFWERDPISLVFRKLRDHVTVRTGGQTAKQTGGAILGAY